MHRALILERRVSVNVNFSKAPTYILSRMVSTRVTCMIAFVNMRARIKYRTDNTTAAAETSSRSQAALLNYWTLIQAEQYDKSANLLRVTGRPICAPPFPRPPPKPPFAIHSWRLMPETATNPSSWPALCQYQHEKRGNVCTCNMNKIKKIGSLTFFFGLNRPPAYGSL